MQGLELAAFGILILACLVLLLNFRFLIYPVMPNLNPLSGTKEFTLAGNTLFIADLHLKAGKPFSFAKDLRSFVDARHVSNLVVVGDLFNSPKDARETMSNSSTAAISKILGLEDLPIKFFWVAGSPDRDPVQKETINDYRGSFNWLGRCASIHLGHSTVLAYHGDDLSRMGAIGHAWNRFISKLSLERLWKRFAKVPETDWAVFGHTHIGALDVKNRVANCGGWVTVTYLVRPSGTGVFFYQENSLPELAQISRDS